MSMDLYLVPDLFSGLCLSDCVWTTDLRLNLSEANKDYDQRCDFIEANKA